LMSMRSKGKTVFINSHLLSEVEQLADGIAVIDHGSILKVGTLDELAPHTGTYTINLRSEVPAGLLRVLAANTSVIMKDTLTLEVRSSSALDSVLATLNENAVPIESIIPNRRTLEDSLISFLHRGQSA
jgi:ABC-2 type transport system ATP-binding protein